LLSHRSSDTGTVYQRVEEVNYLIHCNLHQLPAAREKGRPERLVSQLR